MSGAFERVVLPVPERRPAGPPAFDMQHGEVSFEPIRPPRPPAGAPNILLVMLDDAGFGSSSAFGGPCRAPTFERLAANGLRYTRFHTTAMCSPTRQALLTGRNHHAVGMGAVSDMATAAPGYTSLRPNTAATIAEVLRLNGYSTSQFGKCHEVPTWEWNPMGPFDRWPTGSEFEYFYGFIGGETSQFYPSLVEGTTPVTPDRSPEAGYHLSEDIADKARCWLGQQRALAPDKPFFLYFAPSATHAPIHIPHHWLDRYAGEFDQGWDAVREETFARQKRLGVVPPDAELTARHEGIPAWSEIPDRMKPVLARQMELYAAFLEHTDYCIGQVVDAVEELGVLDDTLILLITGDNGASGEGTVNGTWNEALTMTGMSDIETPEFLRDRLDTFGTPDSYPQYSLGWAHAMDTPYQWTKRIASHWGGTRNGLIVHWPRGITARNELRHQFHHVVDIAPTCLEVAGLPEPHTVHGITQQPMAGVSMAYSFDAPDAPDRHETQYFEILGNRGIYHKGWTACTAHAPPVPNWPDRDFDEDVWELYDTTTDWTQARDLAAERPDKLAELQRLFLIEAATNEVLPLDDRAAERADPDRAGRPVLARGNRQRLYPGIGRLNAFSVINIKNKSHHVTAEVVVPAGGSEGVIVAQGGFPGGWAIYAKQGRPVYCYNFYGIDRFHVEGTEPLPEGTHHLRMEFDYDGGGVAKGGTVRLLIDDRQVGQGRVERTQPLPFASDEPFEIGCDQGSQVTPDYTVNEFTGKVNWVEITIPEGASDHDAEIPPEERMRAARIVE
ncbi:arylsulfatase AtsD [Streptomyces thermolineatus]|uniref:Arylsulfatase AtsD n=1 Tax=Streptomyces thermolineatus TaxID=44033 RepID=A0ABN3MTY8_9ACTN